MSERDELRRVGRKELGRIGPEGDELRRVRF